MPDKTTVAGELPVVAWLIEYGRPADPVRCVYLHNAIADYRERDPGATSQTLIRLSDARQALAVQQGEIERLRQFERRYEWIKRHASVLFDDALPFMSSGGTSIYSTQPSPDELDGAIDAALEQSK